MELVREVLWTWNESLHNFWTSLLTNRLITNCLQFTAIALAYMWAKDRGYNMAVIVVAVTAFYVYVYLDAECHRVRTHSFNAFNDFFIKIKKNS